MKKILDTINHPKATPEKIKQMQDNGMTYAYVHVV